MIKKLLLLAGMGVVVVLALGISGCNSLPDNAAASVNGVIITKDDVADRIRVIAGMSPQKVPADTESEDYKNLQRDVTEQLVSEEMTRQEALKRNIEVSPEEIEDIVDQVVVDKYYGDAAKMEEDFAKRNITIEDLRADIKRRLINKKFIESLKDDISVSEEEVRARYEASKGNYVYPEKRQVRQIVVSSQSQAQQIADRIAAGENFTTLAQQLSIDSKTKQNGGLVGMVPQSALPKEIGQAAFSMSRGQVSGPIKSDLGWYIIKVEMITPPANRTFEDVKDELTMFITNQKLAQYYREYREKARDSYDVQFADDYAPRPHEETTETVSTEPLLP